MASREAKAEDISFVLYVYGGKCAVIRYSEKPDAAEQYLQEGNNSTTIQGAAPAT